MTATVIAGSCNPPHPKQIKAHFLNAPARRASSRRRPTWRAFMTTPTRSSHRTQLLASGDFVPASPPGAIGGAVIKAGRHSAGLSRRQLAREMTVTSAAVRSWEDGTYPLFSMSYNELHRLAAALNQGKTPTASDLDELLLASQCDLLLTGMLQGFEDYAEVPPIDEPTPEGDHARDLLRWALTSSMPDKYRPHAAAGPLLAKQDVVAITAIARDLNSGSRGGELASYGAAFASLADD
jgi:transcriptional regulator with XRE-family HTH domain